MTIDVSRPLGNGSYLAAPRNDVRAAVLVLSGSSGRLDEPRADLLAGHGAVALAMKWFGGEDQAPGVCEIPLESFRPAVDLLCARHPRVAVLGVSKGAEAALLLAARDPRIALVAAMSPTSVVWANVGAGRDGADRPQRSSFSSGGVGLPFVPYDDAWSPSTAVPAFRGLYELSLATYADRIAAAAIPVEAIAGQVLLAAGGDDQVWPSATFAAQITDRRALAGLTTTVLTEPLAGHRIPLPGEETRPSHDMARGGTEDADRVLGSRVWHALAAWISE